MHRADLVQIVVQRVDDACRECGQRIGLARHARAPCDAQTALGRKRGRARANQKNMPVLHVGRGAVEQLLRKGPGKALLRTEQDKAASRTTDRPRRKTRQWLVKAARLANGGAGGLRIASHRRQQRARLMRPLRGDALHGVDHRTELADGLDPLADLGEAIAHDAEPAGWLSISAFTVVIRADRCAVSICPVRSICAHRSGT